MWSYLHQSRESTNPVGLPDLVTPAAALLSPRQPSPFGPTSTDLISNMASYIIFYEQ